MRSERDLRSLTEQSQEDGFRAIFTQYSGYAYAIIWNHIRGVGTPEDAEEAVSDVFADLFRSFAKVGEGKLESYIRMLAKRTAVDLFRRLSARPEKVPDAEETWSEAVSDEDIEQDHDKAALRQQLLECIRSLGEPDATIVIWRYFYDCSAEQIGNKVGLNRIAVRTRLSRAKARLRRQLTDRGITLKGGASCETMTCELS
jgi:RNA polymerase sigma-70 factor (ECF subfamily)